MDQSRSNSVPLLHIDDIDEDEELITNSRILTRSSFSLSSIQQQEQLWNNATEEAMMHTMLHNGHDVEEDELSSSLSTASSTTTTTTSSNSSGSSSDDDEISIAIPGRKTIISNQVNNLLHPNVPMLDLSSDILYEDIWIDSPVFHEYLQSLEAWLYHYLTWLEKIEQCRQLEIAYSKSIALLYDQTKLMLNEPFYTSDECNNLNWPNDSTTTTTKSFLDEDVLWDNKDIRSILRKKIRYHNILCMRVNSLLIAITFVVHIIFSSLKRPRSEN